MNDARASEILATLGILTLRRNGDGQFHLEGSRPIWYLRLFSDAEPSGGIVDVTARFPFLESFLPTAENFWTSNSSGLIRSGFWVESYASGKEVPLKADALIVEDVAFLLIEYVRSDFEHIKGVLQKARENMLEGETADALKETAFRARASLSGLLDACGRRAFRVRGDGTVLERHPAGPRSDDPMTLDTLVDPSIAEEILLRGREAMATNTSLSLDGQGASGRVAAITSEEFWALLDA